MAIWGTIKLKSLLRIKGRRYSHALLAHSPISGLPFELCNASNMCKRCMMGIFSNLVDKVVQVFMNDLFVFGYSFESCLQHLQLVLERCEDKGFVLNWEKCHFMIIQGIVLGHIVSSKRIRIDKSKIELISNLPTPKCVKDVRSFLGHMGFY